MTRRRAGRYPCPVTFVTAGFRLGFYRTRAACLRRRVIFPVSHTRLVEPKRATGVLLSECKSEGGVMRNFSRGIWTWAALYVAFGLIGIFLLTGQSTIVTSSEGYGIAAIASPAPLR
jgi:hypothetical protein